MVRDFHFGQGDHLLEYTVTKQIALGGQSEVYSVEDDYGIRHILKVAVGVDMLDVEDIGPRGMAQAKLFPPKQRIMNEAKMLGRLSHANIVRVSRVLPELPYGMSGLLLENIEDARTLEEIVDMMPLTWNFKSITQDYLQSPSRTKNLLTRYQAIIENPMKYSRSNVNDSLEFCEILIESYPSGSEKNRNQLIGEQLEPFLHQLRDSYISLVPQLESALLYLRSFGIAHRDVRFLNVLVDRQFSLKLIDFEWAGAIDSEPDVWGSRKIEPPEHHNSRLHENSDLWSFGKLIAEMVLGKDPLVEGGTSSQLQAYVQQLCVVLAKMPADAIVLPFDSSACHSLYQKYMDFFTHDSYTNTIRNSLYDLHMNKGMFIKQGCPDDTWLLDDNRTIAGIRYLSERERDGVREAARRFFYLNINPMTRYLPDALNIDPHGLLGFGGRLRGDFKRIDCEIPCSRFVPFEAAEWH